MGDVSEAGWKTWYTEVYLQSEPWKARRDSVLRRASFVCEGCGERPATQVHHRPEAYRQLRKSGRELLCDLVALCDGCHELAHEKQAVHAVAPQQGDPDIHARILTIRQRMETLQKAAFDAPGVEEAMVLLTEHNALCEQILLLLQAWKASHEATADGGGL